MLREAGFGEEDAARPLVPDSCKVDAALGSSFMRFALGGVILWTGLRESVEGQDEAREAVESSAGMEAQKRR